MVNKGDGASKDCAEVVKWFRKTANEGGAHTRIKLGVMYYIGKAVSQCRVESYRRIDVVAPHLPASEAAKRDKAIKDPERVADG